jgi:hypothetical protein
VAAPYPPYGETLPCARGTHASDVSLPQRIGAGRRRRVVGVPSKARGRLSFLRQSGSRRPAVDSGHRSRRRHCYTHHRHPSPSVEGDLGRDRRPFGPRAFNQPEELETTTTETSAKHRYFFLPPPPRQPAMANARRPPRLAHQLGEARGGSYLAWAGCTSRMVLLCVSAASLRHLVPPPRLFSPGPLVCVRCVCRVVVVVAAGGSGVRACVRCVCRVAAAVCVCVCVVLR